MPRSGQVTMHNLWDPKLADGPLARLLQPPSIPIQEPPLPTMVGVASSMQAITSSWVAAAEPLRIGDGADKPHVGLPFRIKGARHCPLKDQCLTPQQPVKVITRGPDDGVRDDMKAKIRTEAGDALY
ncbi:MAG: hypothetical protein M0Z53_07045, partial [Thermaerobacter sp.]|nr:hypothetical protein [Thermaerobacter sp.]